VRELGALRSRQGFLLSGEAGRRSGRLRAAIERADARDRRRRQPARCSSCRGCGPPTPRSEYVIKIRGSEVRYPTHVTTLSGTRQPRVAVPQDDEPGRAGPLRAARAPARHTSRSPAACSRSSARARIRSGCSRARAGPARTNGRFHYLSAGEPAKRLSTAFDSVTLVWLRPGRAARHLREDRRERGQRVHARGRALTSTRASISATEHERQHDDQRACADRAGVLHEHGDRSAGRRAEAAKGGGADDAERRGARPDA
jgi:hypothetical protein